MILTRQEKIELLSKIYPAVLIEDCMVWTVDRECSAGSNYKELARKAIELTKTLIEELKSDEGF